MLAQTFHPDSDHTTKQTNLLHNITHNPLENMKLGAIFTLAAMVVAAAAAPGMDTSGPQVGHPSPTRAHLAPYHQERRDSYTDPR